MDPREEERAAYEERREIRRAAKAVEGTRRVREDEHGVRCLFCPGTGFRRSKLRSKDIRHILFLQYPVRCLRCSQRQYASFAIAGLSVPASVRHQRAPRPQETWKSWTSGASDDPSVKLVHPPSYTPYTTVKLAQSRHRKSGAVPKARPKPASDDDAIW